MSTNEEIPNKSNRKRDRATEQIPITQVYVGPNLPGGTLAQYATFRGPLPPYVDKLLLDKPELGKLFIPPNQLALFRSRVGVPGTAEHRAFQDVKGGL